MTFIIDRFSGGYALLEDGERTVARVPRSRLPADAREGDVLTFRDGGYLVDRDATDARRRLTSELLASLWD